MCKVSVLIPVYNAEASLEKCLNSVMKQTLDDIEIICINDGSTDHSLSILNEYAAKDSRFKIIDKSNTGYGHSMNQGLKLATGEYIGILESDDYADKCMFADLYHAANEQQVKVVGSNFFDCYQGQCFRNDSLSNCIYEQKISPMKCTSLFHAPPAIWSAIYQRRFLLENGIDFLETPGASYQDTAFYFKVLTSLDSIYLLKNAYVYYCRDNPSSSMNSKKKVYCIVDEFDEIERFLQQHMPQNHQLFQLIQAVKYEHYIANYRRISMEYKLEFLHKVVKDFQEAEKKEFLVREYWKDIYWAQLEKMLKNSDDFLAEYYTKTQWDIFQSKGFLGEVRKSKNIYIYGAGNAAKMLIRYLRRQGIFVKACVVSTVQENPENILGVPVMLFGTEKGDRDDCVLVAVWKRDLVKIIDKLHAFGYENVFAVGYDLLDCLK